MQAHADPLDLTFAALADPTRRAILARLTRGEASVGELVEPFEMSQPAISKHLKVLERAGLVTRGRDAQFRPCKLNAAPLERATSWLLGYERFWEESLDNLEQYVKQMQQKQTPEKQTPEKQTQQKEKRDAAKPKKRR
jgi:DNA-binding transcriptional ArsR family regulator